MILQNIHVSAGLTLLKIEGELDFAGAPTVQAALAKTAADRAIGHMVIDLGDITAADDRGVASLAAAVRRAITRRPSLHVVAVTRDSSLADALTDAAVPVYGVESDARRFVDPTRAA